jgi:cytochrome c oxidase subunit IV
MNDHVIPKGIYLLIFVTLLILTLLTVEVSFWNLGILNFHMAVLIASCKSMLVILYFMHVRYNSGIVRIFVSAGFIFLGILLLFSLADLFTRGWQYQPDTSAFSMLIPPR